MSDGEFRFRPLNLGALPAERVGEVLRRPMPEGNVRFTIPAQKHALKHHPHTFLGCLPYAAQAVTAPSYIGQSPHHMDGFEHVLKVAVDRVWVLVAIGLRPTNAGLYLVHSIYQIDANAVGRRVRKGFLVGA
ncbi:MAG: hypothetical protein WD942_09325 [Dehalococcoidia bacterium]